MKKALIILLLLITFQVNAQTNPITGITISLPANPDANTANWGTGVSQLTINASGVAVNGRVDGFVQESKILIIIKKNGAKICGAYTSSTAPASNFNTLTKVWSGSNAGSLIGQTCILPPGDYEISVQFFGYRNGKMIAFSDEKTKAFTIKGNEQQSYQAPQTIAPTNETIFKESDISKPITFRWTPVIPRPQEPVTYRLRVWQLMEGQNDKQARTVNQPVFTKDVDNLTQAIINNLYTGPCKPPYLCDFVWNVQALNREGKPIGASNGTSENFAFSFSSTDKKPPMITLVTPANGSTLTVSQMPTFRWKITVNPVNDPPAKIHKIKIVEIIGDQSPEQALRTNKPHFEKDSLNEIFRYPSTAPVLMPGKKYAWTVDSAPPSMFMVGSCDVNLSLKLRSVECLPDLGSNKRYKISFSSTYTSSTYNLTYTQTGSGLTAYHPSYSPNYSVTNISPALLSQNSGTSSILYYSFEVSVPTGQTAIKIGLQGDDKDPGPITCKPGAELDINLPVCVVPTCDCGKWGPLVLDGKKYDCGSRINWSCQKPFQFTSSYQCSSTDANCKAKTTWEVRKGDELIKSGTGTNTLNDGFSLLTNGTYTLILNANCGDKVCPPCRYTIVVEDCKPPADPCKLLCNTDFEQFVNITGPTTYVQTNQNNIPCWKTTATDSMIEVWRNGFANIPAYSGNYFAELNANQVGTLYQTFTATSPITVTVSFAHRGRYVGNDIMQVFMVRPDGTSTLLGTYAANNATWMPHTLAPYIISTLGNYTLQFKSISSNGGKGPNNGGNFLDAITVTCTEAPPVCDCGTWGPLVLDGKKYECGSRINWSCQKPFQFTSGYQCSTTDANCKAKTTWEVRKGETLIKSGTGTNTLSDGVSLVSNGTYTLTLNANCGDKKCPPCVYTIIVEDCIVDLSCVTPPSDMVGWWTGDKNPNDISGLNNHATKQGGAIYVSGKVQQTFELNNQADYLSVPNHASLNFGTENFSIDAWIKIKSGWNNISNIVDKRTGTSNNPVGYGFYVYDGKLGFQLGDGGARINHEDASKKLNDGKWHFVAVTIDRKLGVGKFYIDGLEVYQFSIKGKPGSINNEAKLLIGQRHINIPTTFAGNIDELEIFKRVLTEDEVVSIFKADSAGKCKDVAPVCDCGKWGPLQVRNAAGGINYDCGTERAIVWNCNKPFDFSSTYQCSPNNESCAAKTTWVISKDGKRIQQGTDANSINGSFTPTANGTYTLTLNANCGDKKCPPCVYTIIVEDCIADLSCVTPPKGMVAWWTFDEKSGQPLVDRAGVNNVGTGINNPVSVPAKVAGGLKFNGTSNYVDVPNHAELNFGTGDFSFDAWIQTDAKIGHIDLVDKRTTKGYLIYLSNGKFGFLLRNGSFTNYTSPLFVADGKWHHIAITVDRKNKKGIIFYLDGVPTQLGDPTLQPGNIDNTSPLRIGGDLYSDNYKFKGILDEIELFKRVLNPAEVQALYAAGSAGKCKDVPPPPPVCDCSKWGSINVKIELATGVSNRLYDCGTEKPIVWNCKKPFDFSSSYQCNPSNESCAAKTTWVISKDGKKNQQGTGTNSIKGSFTPTANGTYTLTLNAICGDKKCPPCTYTIVVEDCSPVLSCVAPPNDMIAWWTFDEKPGQPLVDRAGVNNVGTGLNNSLSVPAKVAGGLKFNGINNHVVVQNQAELNFGKGDFSFDAWIKTDDATIIRPIIDKRSISIGYSIFLYKGKLSLQLNDSGPNTNYVSPLFVADGKWHHIAITVARKNKKGIIFYLDGVPTQLGDPTLRPGNLDNTEPLLIARNANDSDNNGNKIHFKGILDEIELFNRVLTKDEIVSIFKADKAGKCKTDTPTEVPTACNCTEIPWDVVQRVAYNDGSNTVGQEIKCFGKVERRIKTGSKITYYVPAYSCDKQDCKVTYNWKIVNVANGTVYSSGTTTSFPIDFTVPTIGGNYRFEVTPVCGTNNCKPCGFNFTTVPLH